VTLLAIRVYGRPAPEGSHDRGANGHIMHASKYLAAWRAAVRNAALRAAVDELGVRPGDLPIFRRGAPVYLHECTMIVGPDQCRAEGTDEPTGRPDWDKLLRATVDGLGDAVLFAEDSQIVKSYDVSKVRSWPGEDPGAVIIISDEPREAAVISRESNDVTTEYRLMLERVTGRDADGFRNTENTFELFGDADTIASAGLTTVAALLGLPAASIALPERAEVDEREGVTEGAEPKRGRGRPRKTAAPSAPVPAVAVSEPEPTTTAPPAASEPQAPAQTAPAAPQAPVAPARVNPFAS